MNGIQNMYRGLITDSLGKQTMALDSVATRMRLVHVTTSLVGQRPYKYGGYG